MRAAVVLLALAALSARAGAPTTRECPRLESAQASKIVNTVIGAMAEDLETTIAPGCPFHPDKSVFKRQNDHKEFERGGFWKCGFCSKEFRSEEYLDRHMDARHSHEVAPTGSTCLADFCDVLGCPAVAHEHHEHHGEGDGQEEHDAESHHGDNAPQAFARCTSLVHACLDVDWESPRGKEVSDTTVHEFCSKDPCEHGRSSADRGAADRKPRGGFLLFGWVPLWVAILLGVFAISGGLAACLLVFDSTELVGVAPPHLVVGRRRRPADWAGGGPKTARAAPAAAPTAAPARGNRRARHTAVEVMSAPKRA